MGRVLGDPVSQEGCVKTYRVNLGGECLEALELDEGDRAHAQRNILNIFIIILLFFPPYYKNYLFS